MKMSRVCFLTWLTDCLDCLNFPLNIWVYHAIVSDKTIFDLFVFVELEIWELWWLFVRVEKNALWQEVVLF